MNHRDICKGIAIYFWDSIENAPLWNDYVEFRSH